MQKVKIIFILTWLLFGRVYACLNGGRELHDGTVLYEDTEDGIPWGHDYYVGQFPQAIRNLDSLYKKTKKIDFLSDKGVLLVIMGRYNEAIQLYMDIEKIEPNRYDTASNMGTAYELAGQDENALRWIKKAIEIYPYSHRDSEWLHVKILEAKIKGEAYYTAKFLINTDFGTDSIPKSNLHKAQLLHLSDALYHQLNERVSFVKPKDKIVARLLFELGNVEFLNKHYGRAATDYELAIKYGFTDKLIYNRMREAEKQELALEERVRMRQKAEQKSDYLLCGGVVVGIVSILLVVFYKFGKKITSFVSKKENDSSLKLKHISKASVRNE